jgi:hypothetical protein
VSATTIVVDDIGSIADCIGVFSLCGFDDTVCGNPDIKSAIHLTVSYSCPKILMP